MLRRLWDHLLQAEPEQDDGFRRHILERSRQGLRVIVGVEIAVPVLMVGVQLLLLSAVRSTWTLRVQHAAAVMAIGVLTGAASLLGWGRRNPRLLGWLSGCLTGISLSVFSLLLHGLGLPGDHYVPAQIATVLLVGTAALPLRPLQTLGLGVAMWAGYVAAGTLFIRQGTIPDFDSEGTHAVFILMITFVSAALTAVLYVERVSNYRSHQAALRASDNLCKAQSRLLLAENAASLGRVASALSHELNNPVGALRSSVDTLLLLAGRQATSAPDEQKRLLPLQADLRRAIAEASSRLQQIVARLQRYTNLDRAEIQPANLNDIVTDVVALMEPEIKAKSGVRLEFDLSPVAPLLCRPQPLGAVLSNLVDNAIRAITNGGGLVLISTRESDSQVEVRVSDTGRGLRPEDLLTIFDPGFRVHKGRISTGNWSLFSARQIVREQGGDISIESAEGRGTTVSVKLPRLAESELEAAAFSPPSR